MPASTPSAMPAQRGSSFFLASFFTAFSRQQAAATSAPLSSLQQNKQQQQQHQQHQQHQQLSTSASTQPPSTSPSPPPPPSHRPIHSPRSAAPIPVPISNSNNRRRGSDSSSEGFRDVLGADKWYIGGRTAAGEEKFFKLGVVRRVKSGDRLSLDRLSL